MATQTAAEFRAEVDVLMDNFFNYKVKYTNSIRPDITTGLTDYFATVRLSEDGTKVETNDGLSCPVAEATAIYNHVLSSSLNGYSTPSLANPIYYGERVASEIRIQLGAGQVIYSVGLAKLQVALGIDPNESGEYDEEGEEEEAES